MVRSRLPVPSLLCLFIALLMLSPELLKVIQERLSDVSLADPDVQKALALVMKKYNQERRDSANYFKLWSVLKAKVQVENGKIHKYRFQLELVETTCKKKTDTMTYEKIQECERLPGNQEKLILYSVIHLLK